MHLDDKVSRLQNLDLSSSELMVRYKVKDLVPSTFCHLFPLQNFHTCKIALIAVSQTQLNSKHSTLFSLVDSLSQKFFITKLFLLLIATSFIKLNLLFLRKKTIYHTSNSLASFSYSSRDTRLSLLDI